jgi:hypothetical protein
MMDSCRARFLDLAAPEIILEVVEHLNQADLASLATVCKGMHNLAQGFLYRHISLRNDKDALQLIRAHELGNLNLPRHVTNGTRSLVAGNIGKVKLLTILKSCSCRLQHLTIDCRLLSRQDQMEICECLAHLDVALKTIRLKYAQPDFVNCILQQIQEPSGQVIIE